MVTASLATIPTREHPETRSPRALIVSRLDDTKMPPAFVKELLAWRSDRWTIDVLGGAYYPYGRDLLAKLKKHPCVRVLDPVAPAAMPDLYREYDALLATGLIEGGSYALCEAAAGPA